MSTRVNNLKGDAGCIYEKGVTAYDGIEVDVIDCLDDTVFAVLTMPERTGDNPVGDTFPAGSKIFGRVTAFTLTSGRVFAYKKI
jgi:hypothetical protein